MKAAVVSDLHLTSSEDVDNFGMKAEIKFISFCDRLLKDRFDKLFILGDLYDLWQGKGWTELSRFKLIQQRYRRLLNKLVDVKLFGVDIVYLPGNHDYLLHTKFGYNLEYYLHTNIGNILFLHGHQFDDNYRSKFSWFKAKLATQAWGLVETIIGPNTAEHYLKYINKYIDKLSIRSKETAVEIKNKNKDYNTVDYLYAKRAAKYAYGKSMDIIIMGHTHTTYHHSFKINNKIIEYYNSGRLIDGHTDCIFIDTKKDSITIDEF